MVGAADVRVFGFGCKSELEPELRRPERRLPSDRDAGDDRRDASRAREIYGDVRPRPSPPLAAVVTDSVADEGGCDYAGRHC